MTAVRLARLNRNGVSFWLDGISRFLLDSKALAALVRDWRVSGATTNLELFLHAVNTGPAYTEQLCSLAELGGDLNQAVQELAVRDIQWACDVLLPTHLARHHTTGLVSADMDPRVCHDQHTTLDMARTLWRAVDRPNILVKIPATDAGLRAITSCLAEGINVHATSIFSAERYQQVTEAHLTGLSLASEAGLPLSRIHSAASFHVSPIDAAVDPLLTAVGSDRALALRGKTALAAAGAVLERHKETFAGTAWQQHARRGARRQQLVWAATTVNDSRYHDTHYTDGLFAPDTVSIVSEQSLWAVADHGRVLPHEVAGVERERVLDALPMWGISLPEIGSRLEDDAHRRALAVWQHLLDVVRAALKQYRTH
ncbi:transaldolase [Streptomyces spiroverticillatus]|uniref:Transaldolase n=1 Tax=Streptomyces finlayi TaxID=67296 RepID=A0A919C990_9ACTN|nr:transaldolase [Streptomyces finlayi]GHA01159.1 transaldolase [Streptomyces spiroverticillatus]GHC85611.1 transaldolase [Streptomyces finlayi]